MLKDYPLTEHALRVVPALEAFARSHVAPVAIPTTVSDSNVVETSMPRLERLRALKVKDNVGVFEEHRLDFRDLTVLSKQDAATKIRSCSRDGPAGCARSCHCNTDWISCGLKPLEISIDTQACLL